MQLSFVVTLLVAIATRTNIISAHSWIACTDYDEYSGLVYDHAKCHGWPRSGHYYTPKTRPFGYESGYAHMPILNKPCKTQRNDMCAYDVDHPMAIYYAGQTVTIAHPTKNHCNDPQCGEANNHEDNGSFVYGHLTTPHVTIDPRRNRFIDKRHLIANLGVSPAEAHPNVTLEMLSTYPKPGFQNAPGYCLNNDTENALATNNFTLPANLHPGRYSFIWLWYFGHSQRFTNAFSTCWEADVYVTKEEADAARNATNQPAHQDAAVRITSSWGSGAEGVIELPPDYNTSYVIIKFPQQVASFSVFTPNVGAIKFPRQPGQYVIHQSCDGNNTISTKVGFTISFTFDSFQQPCAVSPNQIVTRVVQCGTGDLDGFVKAATGPLLKQGDESDESASSEEKM